MRSWIKMWAGVFGFSAIWGAASNAASWTYAEADEFEVYSEAPAKVTAFHVSRLEDFDWACKKLFKNPAQRSLRTVVVLFDSQRKMLPFMPCAKGRAKEVAGLFQPGADTDFLVVSAEALTLGEGGNGNALLHEDMHRLLRSMGYELPTWLDEGLAEYFSTLTFTARGIEVGGVINRRVQCLREQHLLPLDELLATDHAGADYVEGGRQPKFYSESWLLVHYLLQGAEQDPLGRLAPLMRPAMSVAETLTVLETLTGLKPRELEAALKRYAAHAGSWSREVYLEQGNGFLPVEPAPVGTDHLAVVLEDLRWRTRPEDFDASRVFELAERNPSSPLAYEVLASYAAVQEHDSRKAESYWQRAAERNSKHGYVYLQMAKVRLRSATSLSSMDFRAPDGLADPLRRLLDRAIFLQPSNQEAWECLAQVEAFAENPRPDVLESAKTLVSTMPTKAGTLTALAIFQWRQGDWAASRQLVEQVRRLGAVGQEAERQIRRLSERLEAETIMTSNGDSSGAAKDAPTATSS